jgi:hypothetical protein
MKRLVLFLLLAVRAFAANACAEHPVHLSSTASTISTSGTALCQAGTKNGVTYACTDGGAAAWGFDIQTSCVTNYVTYASSTLDTSGAVAGHKYDLGLYCVKGPCALADNSLAGKLYVHTGVLGGTSFTPALGIRTTALTWATTTVCGSIPCTLPAGQYALVIASDCASSCGALYGDDNKSTMYAFYEWFGGSSGAANINGSFQPSTCTSSCDLGFTSTPGLPAAIVPPITDPGIWASGQPRAPQVLIF